MKKFLTLAALAAVALTSCSNDDDGQAEAGSVIRLGAGIAVTKAPVNSLAELSAVGANIGIYAVSSPWSGSQTMNNVHTTAIDPSDGTVSWSGDYYYPSDGSSLTFYGYHPYADEGTSGKNYVTATDGKNAPQLNFTIDGELDVMYAIPVTGSTKATPAKLTFNHALTQIHFKAVKGSATAGTTIKRISLKKANSQAIMNIADGTLSGWKTPATFDALSNGTTEIPNLPTEITGAVPLMVQPGLSNMLIDVVTTSGGVDTEFKDIKITPESDAQFKAGTSYAITLTFNSKVSQVPIQITADVTPWVTTGTGNGIVQ